MRSEPQLSLPTSAYTFVQVPTNSPAAARASDNIQMGEFLREDTKRIEVNMVAVPQNGVAVVSLVNGLGDDNMWYQYALICSTNNEFNVGVQIWTNGVPVFSPRKVKGTDIRPYDIVKLKMEIKGGIMEMSVGTPLSVVDRGGYFSIEPCPADIRVRNGISISVKTSATVFKGVDASLGKGKSPIDPNGTLAGYSSVFTELDRSDMKGLTWQVYQVKYPRPSAEPIFFAPPNSGKRQSFSVLHSDMMLKLVSGEVPSLQLGGTNGIVKIADLDQFATVGPCNRMKVSFLPKEGIP